MLLLLAIDTAIIATMAPPTKPPSSLFVSNSNPKPKSSSSNMSCRHSPSATLDLLILLLVLFSGSFLLSSYFSYIFNSLSLLLSSHSSSLPHLFPISFLAPFSLFFLASLLFLDLLCGSRSRKCHSPRCKGLKNCMEFDLQLQTEEALRSSSSSSSAAANDDIDRLPWKGGKEGNPDYECLTSELRKMAPTNGRAVLLFRARCGCPIAKLEGWGPKKGKRHKKLVS
ncbi:hypothetical protein RIF29_08150 [Crotalaria pallida]|uniref:Ribosomal protein L34 n=1 Tax=Crotalaria pallida TaxID=3830 RepID=A0AAN9J5B9_CROPI